MTFSDVRPVFNRESANGLLPKGCSIQIHSRIADGGIRYFGREKGGLYSRNWRKCRCVDLKFPRKKRCLAESNGLCSYWVIHWGVPHRERLPPDPENTCYALRGWPQPNAFGSKNPTRCAFSLACISVKNRKKTAPNGMNRTILFHNRIPHPCPGVGRDVQLNGPSLGFLHENLVFGLVLER